MKIFVLYLCFHGWGKTPQLTFIGGDVTFNACYYILAETMDGVTDLYKHQKNVIYAPKHVNWKQLYNQVGYC